MREDIAISVKNISKSFRLPHEKHSSLKDKAVHIFGPRGYTSFSALKNIDFEVKKGEFFGIVGKNGSGKSTLLKILANIYQPTTGEVRINGSLAPFIELGVGFNPELTGRENVFLSGAILGLSRKKIERLYSAIVSFAGLEEFMDQKLKNYSSGMQVRLAFSIAIRGESEILLIDEVLAVGDSAFQSKCFDEFDKLKSQGKTIVLVTHDMDAVSRFCNRAILINDGEIQEEGEPGIVARLYNKINNAIITMNLAEDTNTKQEYRYLKDIKITSIQGKPLSKISVHDSFLLTMNILNNNRVKNIGVSIYRLDGLCCFGTNMNLDNQVYAGQESISIKFNTVQLLPGTYYFKIGLFGRNDLDTVEFIERSAIFKVMDDKMKKYHGISMVNHEWIV
ncbi:MAG TPA: ABC transporter ATP-binding protein [Candidatus Saccharibacteria bacterium]|nr:ABC transporter ATP-binding protein [Candidatus Saccharibacteria bacterium]